MKQHLEPYTKEHRTWWRKSIEGISRSVTSVSVFVSIAQRSLLTHIPPSRHAQTPPSSPHKLGLLIASDLDELSLENSDDTFGLNITLPIFAPLLSRSVVLLLGALAPKYPPEPSSPNPIASLRLVGVLALERAGLSIKGGIPPRLPPVSDRR